MLLLDQAQPRALGEQGNALYHPLVCTIFCAGGLEPSPAAQHKNVLGAALLSTTLSRDGLSPPQSRHDQPFSRGIKIGLKRSEIAKFGWLSPGIVGKTYSW